jgi:uncharacterized membrane protein YukC
MEELQIVPIDHDLAAEMRFEEHYAEVLAFVRKQGHASCFEMMKEFHISYADSVRLMDTLEERSIVDVYDPEEYVANGCKGPRPFMTATRKKKREQQKLEREEAERQQKKQEEKEREQEKKPKAAPVAPQQVPEVRKRTTRRARA